MGGGVFEGVLVILLWTSAHAARRYPYFPVPVDENRPDRLPLQTQRPFNIAHRGSNGEIPEETAEAYMVGFFWLFFGILCWDL